MRAVRVLLERAEALMRRVLACVRGHRIADDIEDEIAAHQRLLVRDALNAGLSPAEAQRRARHRFGPAAQWVGQLHRIHGLEPRSIAGSRLVVGLFRDVHLALRHMMQSPGHTVAAVLVLGLGIGANVAVFSAFRGIVLQPLPYGNQDRLVAIWTSRPGHELPRSALSPADFVAMRARDDLFEWVAGYWRQETILHVGDRPRPIVMGQVSPNFFDALGVAMLRGAGFDGTEALGDVVISHDLWMQDFGGRVDVIGKTLAVGASDGEARQIVGVLPTGTEVRMPDWSDVPATGIQVWQNVLDSFIDFDDPNAGVRWIRTYAALAPGASAVQARAGLAALAADMRSRDAELEAGRFAFLVEPFLDAVVRDVRGPLTAMMSAVVLVLLTACANVAYLMLVRARARRRELAVRRSLGAGALRIARQLFVESLVLALAGGATGAAIGWFGLRLALGFAPADLPRLANVQMDPLVLGVAFSASLGTALLCGVAPVRTALRTDAADVLRGSSRVSERPLGRRVLPLQVAVSIVLLLATTLQAISLRNLGRVDPGFDPEGVLTFQVRSSTPERTEILQRLTALPGVSIAGAVDVLPLSGRQMTGAWKTESGAELPTADRREATPEYFAAMGIELLRGRALQPGDESRAVVVDRRLADLGWPGSDPVGQRIQVRGVRAGDPDLLWMEVVGVVDHARHDTPSADSRPAYYELMRPYDGRSFVVVRTDSDTLALLPAARNVVSSVVPDSPIERPDLMTTAIGRHLVGVRFVALLLIFMTVMTVVLTIVGVFGANAYSLGARAREFAIRSALGASKRRILTLVARQVAVVVIGGLVIGVAVAALLRGFVAGYFYQLQTVDLVFVMAVAATMLGTTAAAAVLPARRIVRTDPAIILRGE